MTQQPTDARSPSDLCPSGLSLQVMLGVVPNWRLFDIATCFGLWRTEGMSKYELISALSAHSMVTVSGLWSVMTRNERQAATKLVPAAVIEVKAASEPKHPPVHAKSYQFPRAVLEMLDNAVFGGRLRKFPPETTAAAAKEPGGWRALTRPLLSILLLLDLGRVSEVSKSFGLSDEGPLEVAVQLERKRVRSRDLLHQLTTDELRLVAAAWTLTAPRGELITRLESAMDAQSTEATPLRTA